MHNNPRDANVERQLETWAASHSGADLSPEVRRKVRDMLTSSLSPVKPLPSQGRLASAFFVVFAALALTLMTIMDEAGFRLMTGTQMAGMATVLTGGGILFSLAVARRMVPGSRSGPSGSSCSRFSALESSADFRFCSQWRIAGAFVSEGWPCASMEFLLALPAAVVFSFSCVPRGIVRGLWCSARRSAVWRPSWLYWFFNSDACFNRRLIYWSGMEQPQPL